MRELPPLMFHFADAVNYDLICREGLLSTNAILGRGSLALEVTEPARAYRPHGVMLPSGAYLRDQSPMPPAAIAACLDDGLTPQEWYDVVNGYVFFWLSVDRMRRHRIALRTRAQMLLTIDTRALVCVHGEKAFVTPFNIGNARRLPARRGFRTLTPVASWLESAWEMEAARGGRVRAASHPPAELLIEGSVPDIERFITGRELISPW